MIAYVRWLGPFAIIGNNWHGDKHRHVAKGMLWNLIAIHGKGCVTYWIMSDFSVACGAGCGHSVAKQTMRDLCPGRIGTDPFALQRFWKRTRTAMVSMPHTHTHIIQVYIT